MTMAILGTTGLTVSKIGLGTVEIGLAYGIGNNGLPSEEEAEYVLKSAVELGITYFDTARGYGLAEERIGKSGIAKNSAVVIGTKCGQFLKNEPDLQGAELEKRIREDIDTSRKNLQQETLQLVQLHIELDGFSAFTELVAIMQKLQEEQKVQHVGMATRGETTPLLGMKTNFFQTLQCAYSILDQRMAPTVMPTAQKENVSIINRSILLQGALTTARVKLPAELQPLKDTADKAEAIAQELGIDLPTLATRFAISNPAVSTALIGTTRPKNIASALKAVESGPLPTEILEKLYTLGITDPNQVDPSKWPKLQ